MKTYLTTQYFVLMQSFLVREREAGSSFCMMVPLLVPYVECVVS